MTIVAAITKLIEVATAQSAAIQELTTRIEGLNMAGMTPEQSAALAQATTDIGKLRDEVGAIRSTLDQVNQVAAGAVTKAEEAAAAVAALRTDVDALKAGVGDLSGLPALPQV